MPMYAVQAAKSSRWDHTLYLICGVFVLIADGIMNMMYQMACKTYYCHLRWLVFAHILIIYIAWNVVQRHDRKLIINDGTATISVVVVDSSVLGEVMLLFDSDNNMLL